MVELYPFVYEAISAPTLRRPSVGRGKAKCSTGQPCGDYCIPKGRKCRHGEQQKPAQSGPLDTFNKAAAMGDPDMAVAQILRDTVKAQDAERAKGAKRPAPTGELPGEKAALGAIDRAADKLWSGLSRGVAAGKRANAKRKARKASGGKR